MKPPTILRGKCARLGVLASGSKVDDAGTVLYYFTSCSFSENVNQSVAAPHHLDLTAMKSCAVCRHGQEEPDILGRFEHSVLRGGPSYNRHFIALCHFATEGWVSDPFRPLSTQRMKCEDESQSLCVNTSSRPSPLLLYMRPLPLPHPARWDSNRDWIRTPYIAVLYHVAPPNESERAPARNERPPWCF